MPRLLLVDDDPDQNQIRRLLLEYRGYDVSVAETPRQAMERFEADAPRLVLMDLRLPRIENGLTLIRRMRAASPGVRIVVLSGASAEFMDLPEAALVDDILSKPVLTETLMVVLAKLVVLLLCAVCVSRAATFPFEVKREGEVVAAIEMRSPGSDWSKTGREAALAAIAVDGGNRQNLMLWAGETAYTYEVFLGLLPAGKHTLDITRDPAGSAPASKLETARVSFREDPSRELAYAPVVFARRNTVGKFTDVPLLAYCERVEEEGKPLLRYTVIFSNEDGGTPTRALMARWGRTTDIEYLYKAYLDPSGKVSRATIQTKDHKEVEFRGERSGGHPLLVPITDNNMVAPDTPTAVRYQLAPAVVDLRGNSRERVMDERPILYRVMAQEMEREGKLRPFGTVRGADISDPRNYVYVEAKVSNRNSRIALVARLAGERRWRAAHMGRIDYAIERSEWVRTALELPPGVTPSRVAEIGFECLVNPGEKNMPTPPAGVCRVERVGKAFLLGRDYVPGASFWSLGEAAEIPSGETATWNLQSR